MRALGKPDIACMESISLTSGRTIGLQIRDRKSRSVLWPVVEQVRRIFDHPFAMLEKPLAVTTDKVDLVLATFLAHRF